jgi:hypothetical protein
MDRILKNILNYEKIIIVSNENEDNDLLSKLIFDSIKNSIEKQRIELNNKYNDTLVNEYRYDDLFYDNINNKSILRKYYKSDFNYLVRVKGNGYNISYMGLVKSMEFTRDAHLYISVSRDVCNVLHDRLEDYTRRKCDLSSLYRSHKIKQLFNNIDGKNNCT